MHKDLFFRLLAAYRIDLPVIIPRILLLSATLEELFRRLGMIFCICTHTIRTHPQAVVLYIKMKLHFQTEVRRSHEIAS